MPYVSNAYLGRLSSAERARLLSEHLTLGVHPTAGDLLLATQVDRFSGTYVLGQQGFGKSGLLTNMIVQDAEKGQAVVVFDPHGDLVTDVLARLSVTAAARTYILDMEDEEYPFGVNLFALAGQFKTRLEREQAAGQLEQLFKMLWPEMEHQQYLPQYLNAATHMLFDNPGSTLFDLYNFLQDPAVRQKMLANVTDMSVKDHWLKQYDQLGDAERMRRIGSLMTRLQGIFMGRSLVRNILAQRRSSVSFRRAIEDREIILIKLPFNTLGENAYLVGTLLLSQLTNAIFSFANVESAKRPGVSLFVDEFQHFATPDFSRIFTEGRKYGVRMTVAHQYRKQLTLATLRDSTKTSRTKICLRANADDAGEMAEYFPSTDSRVDPDSIIAHPVEYLKANDVGHPPTRVFTQTYLMPLKGWLKGGKVMLPEVTKFNWYRLISYSRGGYLQKVQDWIEDPTDQLERLLRDVMKTGDYKQPIPWEIVVGFCHGGRGYFKAIKGQNVPEMAILKKWPSYIPGLIVHDGDRDVWVGKIRNDVEQLQHFIFHLRLTMLYLAEHPIGKVKATSASDVAAMLTQLPFRAAFVHTGDTIGVMYSSDTPPAVKGADWDGRLNFVRQQTRQKYCHPRDQVEAALQGTQSTASPASPVVPPPIIRKASPSKPLQTPQPAPVSQPLPDRWEDVEP